MKFGKAQSAKFGTPDGAYSYVTETESSDSQITLTDYEAQLVISYFGKKALHVGNVKSNSKKASKPFLRYPRGEEIHLNLVFPKADKTELRLYLSKSAGFKPVGGEIWFLFAKGGVLWIGAMSEYWWRKNSAELIIDESDQIFQESLLETDSVRITELRARDVYQRNRKLALKKLELSGYQCEFDPEHNLFISRYSKKPYLEAHHLVPIGFQGQFDTSIDVLDNISCLCPYCHCAVHNAEASIARTIVSRLAEKNEVLSHFQLSIEDLYSLYAIEEII